MSEIPQRDLVVDLKNAESRILRKWERRVRAELPEAKEETTLVLRNHLPKFLRELEDTLEDPESKAKRNLFSLAAKTHGVQRAKKTEFSLNQVVFEYEILRQTIFDELEINKPLTPNQREAVLKKIAEGVARATEEFSHIKVTDEKARKLEAQAGEKRYRELLNKLDHAIAWEADPDTLRFHFVSQRAEDLLGYPISEWMDDPNFISKRLHPDDARKFSEMVNVARKTGQSVRGEHRLIDKKGVVRWFQSGIDVEKDEENNPVLFRGLCVDITPFKHFRLEAEEALAELQAFLQSSPVGAGLVDGHLRYKRINEPLAKLNGRSVHDHIGKTVREVLGDKAADFIEPFLSKVLKTGETVHIEVDFPIAHDNNNPHHLLATYYLVKTGASILGVGATIVDVTNIKATERELKEAQDRYDLALKAADIGVWELYFDSPTIKWSPRQFYLFDVDPATSPLTFEIFESRIYPEDRARVMKEFDDAVKERRDFALEYRIQRRSGEICWIAARGRTIYDETGKPLRMMGTNLDVTEQKKAIETLRENEARIRLLIESMPQMTFINDASGKLLFLNKRHYEYFGISNRNVDEWQKIQKEYHHPDEFSETLEKWGQSLKTGKDFEQEYRLRRADGQWRWHLGRASPVRDTSGKITYWLGTNTDIHDQKILNEKLRESEQSFRTLANTIPQLAWMANADGYVFWYNDRWFDYTGAAPKEMEGWGWQAVHDPKELPKVMKVWKNAIADKQSMALEFPIRGKDGHFRWFLTKVVPLKNEKGEVLRWFGTNTDIEDQKRNRDELRKLLADLENERDLGEQFVATLTHDLKNPLTAIKTNAEILRRYSDKPDALERTRARILTSVERADKMIDDLLTLYRVRAGHDFPILIAEADLVQICHDLIDEFIVIYGDRFVCDGPETLRGKFDAKAIRRAIENLVVNAVKYGASSRPIVISSFRLKDDICISVKNEGAPIPEENRSKLFQPFQRLDKSEGKKGWGIGLAQVKTIAEAHGGNVEVESSKENGTIFRIKIPKGS